jgi:hypothetical protein
VLPEAGAPGTLTARKENNKLIQEAFTVLYRNRGEKTSRRDYSNHKSTQERNEQEAVNQR